MHDGAITTFLFTDIEGSTRLWEEEPLRMREALARHDALARAAVEDHGGRVVKMTGDGVHAAFEDPLGALEAALALQWALEDKQQTAGLALRVRCGLHAGVHEMRDGDFYGGAVNRAARIMSAAHGGQTLMSRTVAEMLAGRLRDGVTLRDLGTARLRDLARPERVFQAVHPSLRAEFPPLRSLERTPNNLPNDVTSFVGREREIGEVHALLEGHRLVTIAGMGGLGKTRLALHVAADEVERFPDGVWLVELATLTDPLRLEQVLAVTLGLREEPGRGIAESLDRFLASRRCLLVIDNCEHLVAACARLAARILRTAPGVKILATSREPLHIAGEATYPLSSLAVPSLRAPFEPGVLDQYDAVTLFVERAAAVQPGFAVTAENAAAIGAICHRLDGIPLALELAAARVRALSVDKIAERLNYRFKLLKGADHTVLPRQQTLQALIDWSHDLLDDAERRLFRELAVFAGGWTLEAAEALCDGGGGEEVIDVLGRLVEKSLVEREEDPDRYWMLQTVREYALARLEESGEAADARRRHFAHYAALAAEAKPHLVGAEQAMWLGRLDAELDNFLAAHGYALQDADVIEAGLGMLGDLKLYWGNRGMLELARRALVEALARAPAASEVARCRALFDAGQMGCLMGDYAGARTQLEESLAHARRLGAPSRVAAVLQPLGWAAMAAGALADARAYLEEAVAVTTELGQARNRAAALMALAQVERLEGRDDAAEALNRQGLAIAAELGDEETQAIALLNLAMVLIARGDASGPEHLARASRLVDRIESRRLQQTVLEVSAGLAMARGDAGAAAMLYGRAEESAREMSVRRDPADESFLAPFLQQARKQLGAAEFQARVERGRLLGVEEALANARALWSPQALTYR